MNKKTNNTPQHLMDLMIGYSKQNSKSLIPICINKLFVAYFLILKKQNLFRLKFIYPEIYHVINEEGKFVKKQETKYCRAISSISSNIALSNECYKLIFRIGNNFVIHANILESETNVNVHGNVMLLRYNDGKIWKISRKLTKYFDIMVRINRKTICSCENSNGNFEIFFKNLAKMPEISLPESKSIWWWQATNVDNNYMKEMLLNPRIYGDIHRDVDETLGYCKIALNDDFDYDSNQQVSIEAYGIDKMNIWSTKHANQAIDKHGFGASCCTEASFQYFGLP